MGDLVLLGNTHWQKSRKGLGPAQLCELASTFTEQYSPQHPTQSCAKQSQSLWNAAHFHDDERSFLLKSLWREFPGQRKLRSIFVVTTGRDPKCMLLLWSALQWPGKFSSPRAPACLNWRLAPREDVPSQTVDENPPTSINSPHHGK